MIAGIGTDIISIARIRAAIERHEGRFARKVLADSEMDMLASRPDAATYVAKRFAAKEAFFKAFGQPSSSANTWHQLAVENLADGRPHLRFGAGLATLMASLGIDRWHVTLSDEREYAVAFIILEKSGA
jgi:holo-[acyl-carrier protein] synthase